MVPVAASPAVAAAAAAMIDSGSIVICLNNGKHTLAHTMPHKIVNEHRVMLASTLHIQWAPDALECSTYSVWKMCPVSIEY